jgi:hypothetical protein
MVVALTRGEPADSLLVMLGMPISAPARRDKTHVISAPHLCSTHHHLCLGIIDPDGMTGMKR